jgi:hypothetical protein
LDIGNSEARYVRDLELAALLKTLTDKGLLVTVVLDCCHSGGATRAISNNVGVRGVSFVDSTKRPPGDVVIPDEIKAAFKKNSATRGLTVASGFLLEPKGYTLLAACRPSESAYEFAFNGNERNGALTYWLLDTLGTLGPNTSYKDVYDRILAKVHSQFELQTPMLEGDAERTVFGVNSVPSRPTAIVLKINDGGKNVTIGGGQATGLRTGAQLAVFSRGETDVANTSKRKTVIEIDDLGATQSSAKVLPPVPKSKVEEGDQAVLLGSGSAKLIRGIRLLKPDGKANTKTDAALQAIAKSLPGNGWLEIAAEKTPAEFVVTLTEDGSEYIICDPGGEAISNLRPAVNVKDENAAQTVVKRLVHLAKYRAVQELDNFDQNSALKGKLGVELVGFEKDYDPADRPNPKPFPNPRQAPTLQIGETAFLQISNKSSQVLNITVLDLEPSWKISQAFPGGQNVFFEPLDPGSSLPLIPLTANLPADYDKGTDVIKVLATVGPSNFQVLTLPMLDQPSDGRAARAATRSLSGVANPLDTLLASVAADQPQLRSLTPQSNPSSEWVVAQIEVKVVRESEKAETAKPKRAARKRS